MNEWVGGNPRVSSHPLIFRSVNAYFFFLWKRGLVPRWTEDEI